MGDHPGGIAQVVNQYLSWDFASEFTLRPILTLRRKRDPAAPALTAVAALTLMAERVRGTRIASFHLSERGSFVREGGLLLLASRLGVRTVAHLHGAEFAAFAQRRPGLVRRILSRADAVAALTDESVAISTRMRGGADGTFRIVNGLSAATFRTSRAKEEIILFGGELSRRKGFDLLVEAWPTVLAANPSWRIVAAGPDPEGRAEQFRRLPNTRYVGSVHNSELLALAESARVAVLPSRAEALPMFLLESMAKRCAVVSTDVGQISTLVDDEVGRLLAQPDSGSLAAALNELISGGVDLDGLGSNAHDRVLDRHSESVVSAQLVRIWKSLEGSRT